MMIGISAIQRWAAIVAMLAGGHIAQAAEPDPHRVPTGFFDLHVCNWPGQPLFIMALFSTTRFDDLAEVTVLRPDGEALGRLDLARYMPVATPGKPEKRVFITLLPLPADRPEGWYSARIRFRDGAEQTARDRLLVREMPRAEGLQPPDGANALVVPGELRWDPVPGATHYQVYVYDVWQDGKEVVRSRIIDTPYLKLSPGQLQPGGLYRWRVNARDVNEHPEFGDFNDGSLSEFAEFEIAGK